MRLPIVLVLCCLAGCQRTLLERAPAQAECDPALVGTWRSQDENDPAASVDLRIDSQCQMQITEQDEGKTRTIAPTLLSTARIGDRQLVWLGAAWASSQYEKFEASSIEREGDQFVFEYRMTADTLEVWAPAHKTVAHAIVDERYDGEVLRAHYLLVNRITGDPLPALGSAGFFDHESAIHFRRLAAQATP